MNLSMAQIKIAVLDLESTLEFVKAYPVELQMLVVLHWAKTYKHDGGAA